MNADLIRAEDLKLMDYHCIVSIDPESGYGRCLLPVKPYSPELDPEHFPYEEVMASMISENITEENISETIEKMHLSTVTEALSKENCYRVHYSCFGENRSVIYRKASFIRSSDGNILLFLRDNTDEVMAIRQTNLDLREERERAIRQSNISSRMLHLIDRDFRTHLFSISGLTDMLMAENLSKREDSFSYDREDQLIEEIYVAENQMIETLNDVREIRNLMHWDETLQDDHISIEEMLFYFDGPMSEHCEFRNTLFTWDASAVENMDIICDENILSSLLFRLVRYIVMNSSVGGTLQLKVLEEPGDDGSSLYTFSILSDHCNLSSDQVGDAVMDYAGLFKEMQKDLNDIDFNQVLVKKYTELLKGKITIDDTEEGKKVDLSLRLPRFTDRAGTESRAADASGGKSLFMPSLKDLNQHAAFAPPEGSGEPAAIPDFSGKTALVVDDNVIHLEVTTRLLKNAGFLVVDVDEGQKGLEAFRQDQGRFDIIILDVRMPGMTGIDVAKQIRASGGQGADIPIIALTANDLPEERKQSIDAGMDDHLSKPVNPYYLYQIIKKYL